MNKVDQKTSKQIKLLINLDVSLTTVTFIERKFKFSKKMTSSLKESKKNNAREKERTFNNIMNNFQTSLVMFYDLSILRLKKAYLCA